MNGNIINGYAAMTYADGQQGTMAEVMLSFEPAQAPSVPFQTESPSADSVSLNDSSDILPPHDNPLADILNWEGVALQREGDTIKMVETGSALNLTNLLANSTFAGINQVDMRGAGNNTLNVHDFLDFSGSDHPLVISGDAGDVVNVQHAINTVLGANTTVVVDGVSHATDLTGHTTIGADSFVVHQTVDALHTVLADDHVVVNFLR
ncbi:MAG: hypothetical protein HQL64_12295 [Magnetococcales bacterium]|nr:hypothetical protein [Magnetococcales bacterium]